MNLWMKRAIGAAALSGGLLALSAGAASAQDVSADVSANLGRSTSAEVRVCADGRVLSGLLGSCGGSGTSGTVQAGRNDGSTGVRARARLPRTAQADVSVGTRRSRPGTTAVGSARADAAGRHQPRADASASLTRRPRRLLDLDATASLAGVGLLGSSPFTLVGDPATDNLLPTGELTLDDLTGEAPAGIGVLDTGPIASGNQVGVNAGDVSPSVPVTVCGNGVGVLGDASASCAPGQPAAPSGGSTGTGSTGTSAGTGDATSDSLLGSFASGNQVDAGIGDISPSVPVTVCGNGVGVLGDASASCGTGQPATSTGGRVRRRLGLDPGRRHPRRQPGRGQRRRRRGHRPGDRLLQQRRPARRRLVQLRHLHQPGHRPPAPTPGSTPTPGSGSTSGSTPVARSAPGGSSPRRRGRPRRVGTTPTAPGRPGPRGSPGSLG